MYIFISRLKIPELINVFTEYWYVKKTAIFILDTSVIVMKRITYIFTSSRINRIEDSSYADEFFMVSDILEIFTQQILLSSIQWENFIPN